MIVQLEVLERSRIFFLVASGGLYNTNTAFHGIFKLLKDSYNVFGSKMVEKRWIIGKLSKWIDLPIFFSVFDSIQYNFEKK